MWLDFPVELRRNRGPQGKVWVSTGLQCHVRWQQGRLPRYYPLVSSLHHNFACAHLHRDIKSWAATWSARTEAVKGKHWPSVSRLMETTIQRQVQWQLASSVTTGYGWPPVSRLIETSIQRQVQWQLASSVTSDYHSASRLMKNSIQRQFWWQLASSATSDYDWPPVSRRMAMLSYSLLPST